MTLFRKLSVLFLAGSISACTFIHPPPPNLPARGSITPGETITVGSNQNVYAVARKYNVSMRDLIVLNDLKPPFTLKPGQSLTLPYGSTGPLGGSGGAMAPTPYAAPASDIEEIPLSPIEPAPVTPAEPGSKSGNAIIGGPVTAAPVEALNAPLTPAKPVATTATLVAPEHPAAAIPASSPAMKWPVQGPVLSGFGPKGKSLNNDGVNIGAPKGAPVVAAANGIVVYVGNEMKGFGNLILIRHQGGWVTAYAHLDRTIVHKDAIVAQGDMIGTVGKTGDVPSPQLHFETRYNGKSIDPAGVIKD